MGLPLRNTVKVNGTPVRREVLSYAHAALCRYAEDLVRIENRKAELSMVSKPFDGQPRAPERISNPTLDAVIRFEKDDALRALNNQVQSIHVAFDSMDRFERELCRLFYVQGADIDTIGKKLGVRRQFANAIHKSVLAKVAKAFNLPLEV